MPDAIQKLIDELSHLPGVGPRQARRFAYYFLTRDSRKTTDLVELIQAAKKSVASCADCQRLFSKSSAKQSKCTICADETRDKTQLMVVAHDVDVDSIEKSAAYKGYYFVLGGTIPILDEKPESHVRLSSLKRQVSERSKNGLIEIVLGLDLNPEGEHTTEYLSKYLNDQPKGVLFKISILGRGLSTGTELQYSDPDTIKNALKNRS